MKTLFTFSVDNVVDLITNSSSELFVLKGDVRDQVEDMVKAVYPKYEKEYRRPVHIDELTPSGLEHYMHQIFGYWPNKVFDPGYGFTFDELFEPDRHGKGYTMRDDLVTDENREAFADRFDPDRTLWFLYSIDDNPDWDMQEKLMEIGTRYHLG